MNYLKKHYQEDYPSILRSFEQFHTLLVSANQKVNLISRKTPVNEFWTRHYLDCILPAAVLELNNKAVLDFGTGGGLPGIPLKIIFPDSKFYLLDATARKILFVKNIIKKLDLNGCFTIVSRLEKLDSEWNGYFDALLSRSVRITPEYYFTMTRLLRRGGHVYLYRGTEVEVVGIPAQVKAYAFNHPALGTRNLLEIKVS
ncbi:MAG: 16S rRNA (guanine(527)-N(7))-methyltransferase RsmG [Candidatus Cloacimonetes bacterium]|nr:16S rRNA (guanine(527)-N(7))-methyltransferase RsmG [Candidatus Cloacimonadota bacterium]